VLIDDLVTLGTKEPYRLFTSRAEYRLLLREDNADMRLLEIGWQTGLVAEEIRQQFIAKKKSIAHSQELLHRLRIKPTAAVNRYLEGLGSSPIHQAFTLVELLRRPEVKLADLLAMAPLSDPDSAPDPADFAFVEEIELEVKYAGYIKRQQEQVDRFKKLERTRLPDDIEYTGLPGLSNEVVEKLNTIRPFSLGQASRISGVTPAAVSVLQVHLKKLGVL
jgi:tRNA uridine 5-carboxymethylaminomethyl modification enzyme